MSESSPVHVMIISNNQELLAKCYPFLYQQGYDLIVTPALAEAVELLQKSRPRVILLSWTLKNTNVKGLYRYFSEKLKIPCLVFAEDSQPRVTSALMRSRIPHTLFPPISGPSIHTRITNILKGEPSFSSSRRKTPKYRAKKSKSFGAVQVLDEEIESETVWEEAAVPKGDLYDGDRIWKGVAPVSGNKQNIYFFKGPKKPEYDPIQKRWSNLDMGSVVLMQQRALSPPLSQVQLAEQDTNIFGLIQKAPAVEEDIGQLIEILPEFQSQSSGLESILAKSVRIVMTSLDLKDNTGSTSPQTNSILLGMVIATDRFRGYLVCGGSDNKTDIKFIINFYQKLQVEMRSKGEAFLHEEEVCTVELEQISFCEWSIDYADFLLSGTHRDKQWAFAYIPVKTLPAFIQTENTDLLSVDHRPWLWVGTAIRFDLYLHMPKNNKHLLYLKKGTLLTNIVLEKFDRFQVSQIFISPVERLLFHSYCIARLIFESAKSDLLDQGVELDLVRTG